jgi:outer membrane protein assembly factor BamD (BamD/ComL family)
MLLLLRHSACILLAALACAPCGCRLFNSNADNSFSTVDPDDVATGTDPNKQKPLIDPENFKADKVRRRIKVMMGKGPDRNVARNLYEQGTEAYNAAAALEGDARKQKFAAAAKHFVDAADRWPDSSLEQDALFMAGESYYFADQYVNSNRQYELLVKKNPNSRHLDIVEARRFVIAQYWIKENDDNPYATGFNFTDPERPWFDTRGNGLRIYEKIRTDDPTGKLSDDATLAAANERFAKREWNQADILFQELVTVYPDSEHQFTAHFLGLKAKLNTYRGSDYEGSSLDDGEKLIKQMRRMFPKESGEEREFLDRCFAEIRYKKAERVWKNADYYYQRADYGGARFYYESILRDFDDTPFAQQATQRMDEIQGKPDKPPQRLKWLVNLFPESDELKPILDKALVKPGEEPRTASLNVDAKQ